MATLQLHPPQPMVRELQLALFHLPGEEQHPGALAEVLEWFKQLKLLYELTVFKSSKLLKAI